MSNRSKGIVVIGNNVHLILSILPFIFLSSLTLYLLINIFYHRLPDGIFICPVYVLDFLCNYESKPRSLQFPYEKFRIYFIQFISISLFRFHTPLYIIFNVLMPKTLNFPLQIRCVMVFWNHTALTNFFFK